LITVRRFADGKVYINGIEGFWGYANERLLNYRVLKRDLFEELLRIVGGGIN